MFYIFNLILPCVFISFVGLFVFILPPNSGEKVRQQYEQRLSSRHIFAQQNGIQLTHLTFLDPGF